MGVKGSVSVAVHHRRDENAVPLALGSPSNSSARVGPLAQLHTQQDESISYTTPRAQSRKRNPSISSSNPDELQPPSPADALVLTTTPIPSSTTQRGRSGVPQTT